MNGEKHAKQRDNTEPSPSEETWLYLEALERQAQLRRIRRQHERTEPVEVQPRDEEDEE